MCSIDCPDRGKCYLENQAQCCPVYRVNCTEGQLQIRKQERKGIYNARRADKRNPIPGAAERESVMDDTLLPDFMKRIKLERLKEVYR